MRIDLKMQHSWLDAANVWLYDNSHTVAVNRKLRFVPNFVPNYFEREETARDPMLTHHKLKVYQKALALAAGAAELCSR